MLGERPAGTSIDRWPDPNGNYEPGNCRWASIEEQARNKRNSVNITYLGKTMVSKDWAKEIGISYSGIMKRIKLGWTIEKILTTKVNSCR